MLNLILTFQIKLTCICVKEFLYLYTNTLNAKEGYQRGINSMEHTTCSFKHYITGSTKHFLLHQNSCYAVALNKR